MVADLKAVVKFNFTVLMINYYGKIYWTKY